MVRNAVKSFVRKNKFHSYLTREILPVEEKVSVFDDHGKTPSCQTFADGPMRKVTLRGCVLVYRYTKEGNINEYVITPRMAMKTIGISSCIGTPGQPPLRRSSKLRVHGNFGQRGNYET